MMSRYSRFNLSFLGLRGRHNPSRRRDRISEQEPAEVRPPSYGILPSGTVSSNPLPSSAESANFRSLSSIEELAGAAGDIGAQAEIRGIGTELPQPSTRYG
jgi:hypothetical protein